MELLKLLTTFLVGVFAGFIGALVGSGGLISIPFLIFLGLPPQVAIATHKFGAVGLKLGAIAKFWKTPHIQREYLLPFAILSFVAAFAGAQLLITIDRELLSRIVGVLLLLVLPLLFVKKETGITHRVTSALQRAFGYCLYFLAEVYAAFFGGGAGTIAYYVLMTFFGFTIVEASATAMLPGLIMSIVTLIIFGLNGILHYQIGAVIFLGMLAGGWLGAHTALQKGNVWVKAVFVAVVVLSAIKLLVG